MDRKKRRQRTDPSKIINSAIKEGIDAIIHHHPRFAGFQGYIAKHLDRKKLKEKVSEIYKASGGMNSQRREEYLYDQLSNYVSTGAIFDEAGQRVILRKGLEEEAKKPGVMSYFSRKRAKGELEGEKYLDNTLGAFQDLYELFKTGDYAGRMPEVGEAVTTLNDMNFLSPALDILKYHKLIDNRRYRSLKGEVRKKSEESTRRVVGGIESYLIPRKVVASVLGIFGIGVLVASGMQITGGVVGIENLENNIAGAVAGILLLISSLVLFFRKLR